MSKPASVIAVLLTLSACGVTDAERTTTTLPEPATIAEAAVTSTTASLPPISASTPPTTTPAIPTTAAAVPESPVTSTTAAPTVPEDDPDAPPPPGAGAGDSFYPWLGNSGYDVTHYDISLDVDPVANTIDGVTIVHAEATADLATLYLDLSGLEVSAVDVDGAPAEFSRLRAELVVHPSAPIPDGSSFTVEIAYSGIPEGVRDPGVPFTPIGWFSRNGVVFTANEPSGSMSWFPSNNHPTDKATFTTRITVPEHLTAASNGLLIDETVVDGRRTATWHMGDPMAPYLAAVYIGDFERHTQAFRDDLLIRNYIPTSLSERERQATLDALSITPGAIEYFEGLLGSYPFDAYGAIVTPFTLGFAMENQTLSLHGRQTLGAQFIAHELAHQWFGNSVTAADWSDIWLHEGFAHYLSFLYLAEVQGEDLDVLMSQELEAAIAARAVPPGAIAVPQLFDFDSVYRRATLTLHALHRHVGDDAFFEILRRHYAQAAGGTATTAELTAIVAELGGIDAEQLLGEWLYAPATPTSINEP